MTPGRYVVAAGAPLADVNVRAPPVSAVIVDAGRPVGRFTATDALRALGVILREAAGS
jgi:hypothetical protein